MRSATPPAKSPAYIAPPHKPPPPSKSPPAYPSPSSPQPPRLPSSYNASTVHPAPHAQPQSPVPPSRSARAAAFLAQFKESGKALVATQRPWHQALEPAAFCRPASYGQAFTRFRRNICYFRANYALAALAIFTAGLCWHPSSLLCFLGLAAGWFFLYFARDEALVVFGRRFEEGTMLAGLWIATVMALIFTDIASSIFGAMMMCMGVVAVHAVARKTEDLFMDEAEAAGSGLISAGFGFPAAGGGPNPVYVRVM